MCVPRGGSQRLKRGRHPFSSCREKSPDERSREAKTTCIAVGSSMRPHPSIGDLPAASRRNRAPMNPRTVKHRFLASARTSVGGKPPSRRRSHHATATYASTSALTHPSSTALYRERHVGEPCIAANGCAGVRHIGHVIAVLGSVDRVSVAECRGFGLQHIDDDPAMSRHRA